jgi:hypothetical protein
LDVNNIECPQICPVFCSEDEHMEHGGIDSRGCMTQDRCVGQYKYKSLSIFLLR